MSAKNTDGLASEMPVSSESSGDDFDVIDVDDANAAASEIPVSRENSGDDVDMFAVEGDANAT